jgi:hypothetical protein
MVPRAGIRQVSLVERNVILVLQSRANLFGLCGSVRCFRRVSATVQPQSPLSVRHPKCHLAYRNPPSGFWNTLACVSQRHPTRHPIPQAGGFWLGRIKHETNAILSVNLAKRLREVRPGTQHGRRSKESARDNGSNSCEPAHADGRRPVRRATGKPTL